MIAPDPVLTYLARRKPEKLTPEERVAIALLRRRGIRAAVLAKAFGVGRNTIYNSCIRDTIDETAAAKAAHMLIEAIGEEAAWDRFVTPAMVAKVDQANAAMAA